MKKKIFIMACLAVLGLGITLYEAVGAALGTEPKLVQRMRLSTPFFTIHSSFILEQRISLIIRIIGCAVSTIIIECKP